MDRLWLRRDSSRVALQTFAWGSIPFTDHCEQTSRPRSRKTVLGSCHRGSEYGRGLSFAMMVSGICVMNRYVDVDPSGSVGTVVSMYEDPFPGSNNPVLPQKQQVLLEKIRRNIINVFRQLSKAERARGTPNPLMILNLRQSIKFGEDGLSEQSEEFIAENGASLLFYYLFDDWYLSYGLVARQEHQYGAIMNELVRHILTLTPHSAGASS